MKKKLFSAFAAALFLISCNDKKASEEKVVKADTAVAVKDTAPMPGSDRDAHGCIGSAGYVWSPVKNDCIRIFEQKKLLSTDSADQKSTTAFFLLSADETKAELYMPGSATGIVLGRTGKEGGYVWKNDSLEIFTWKGYALRKAGKVIFHGE